MEIWNGNVEFVDSIKVKISRWDHPALGWAPNPVSGIFIREKEKRHRDTGGKAM